MATLTSSDRKSLIVGLPRSFPRANRSCLQIRPGRYLDKLALANTSGVVGEDHVQVGAEGRQVDIRVAAADRNVPGQITGAGQPGDAVEHKVVALRRGEILD